MLHLLYARFWHKVLFDLGHVSSEEPFHKLFNQGYIQAYAYTDARGIYVPAERGRRGARRRRSRDVLVRGRAGHREYGKMGKSLKNVVTPDEMYDAYGADTFRVYEMSMGPLDVSRPWETRAVVGSQRFLQRVWRLLVDEDTGELRVDDDELDAETLHVLHTTIDGVRADMEHMRFNTAIAKLIELTNHLTKAGVSSRAAVEPLVLMLAPLAPHLAEELWSRLGHAGVADARGRSRSRTRRTWRPRRSPASSRCWARCAASSRSAPTITDDELTRAGAGRAQRRHARSTAARSARSS